jgi:hypothetical protein
MLEIRHAPVILNMKTHFLLATEIPIADITGYTKPIHETEPLMLECKLKRPLEDIEYSWRFQTDAASAGMEKADYVTVSKTSKFSRPSSHVIDSGHYMCTATSKHGSSTVAIVVKILPKNIPADKEDARKYSPVHDASVKDIIHRNMHNIVVLEFSALFVVTGLLIVAFALFVLVTYVQHRQKVAKYGGFMLQYIVSRYSQLYYDNMLLIMTLCYYLRYYCI